MSRSRDISIILGATEAANADNTSLAASGSAGGVDSSGTLTLVNFEKNIFRIRKKF